MYFRSQLLYNVYNYQIYFRSERLSSKPLHEHDSDSSSDEEIGDRNTTQRNDDSVQQNSIDGITEESQA